MKHVGVVHFVEKKFIYHLYEWRATVMNDVVEGNNDGLFVDSRVAMKRRAILQSRSHKAHLCWLKSLGIPHVSFLVRERKKRRFNRCSGRDLRVDTHFQMTTNTSGIWSMSLTVIQSSLDKLPLHKSPISVNGPICSLRSIWCAEKLLKIIFGHFSITGPFTRKFQSMQRKNNCNIHEFSFLILCTDYFHLVMKSAVKYRTFMLTWFIVNAFEVDNQSLLKPWSNFTYKS